MNITTVSLVVSAEEKLSLERPALPRTSNFFCIIGLEIIKSEIIQGYFPVFKEHGPDISGNFCGALLKIAGKVQTAILWLIKWIQTITVKDGNFNHFKTIFFYKMFNKPVSCNITVKKYRSKKQIHRNKFYLI